MGLLPGYSIGAGGLGIPTFCCNGGLGLGPVEIVGIFIVSRPANDGITDTGTPG